MGPVHRLIEYLPPGEFGDCLLHEDAPRDAQFYTYERLLQQSASPFDPVTSPEDFHLTVFHLESFRPEVVFDLDYRDGRARFHRTRFSSSLHSALFEVEQANAPLPPVPTHRVSAELPPDHQLLRLVRDEYVFRMREIPSFLLDGTRHTLVFTHASGCVHLSHWEGGCDDGPDTGWPSLLEALDDANGLLPFGGPFGGGY